MNAFLFLTISFFSFVCSGQIDEAQANILNQALGKDYDVAKWNTPLILHFDRLPEQQFPAEFNEIPDLIAVDLMPQYFSSNNEDTQNLTGILLEWRSRIRKAQKSAPDRKVELEKLKVWLNGYEYSVIKPIGSGCQGQVYEILQTATETRFALKVYTGQGGVVLQRTPGSGKKVWTAIKSIKSDLLALARVRASQPYLVKPLVVNVKNSYVIYPLLKLCDLDTQELEQFRKTKLEPSLEQDGLSLGDSKPDNYMLSYESSEIVRIDLGSLKKRN